MIKKRSIIYWLPSALWMVLIFILSSQPAASSNYLSEGVTKLIIEFLGRILPIDIEISTAHAYVSQLNHVVRKLAHFFAYMILGILVSSGFKMSGSKKVFLFPFAICVIYAFSDELHQLFVPGRGCQLKDIIIDSAGSLSGIFLAKEYFRLSEKYNRRRL